MKKISIIGIDTSHAVEFPKRFQDPAFPEAERVSGVQVVKCLKFPTAFTNAQVMAERQSYLESLGVSVTENFDEAVSDCDGILIEINDPALHLEYFRRCAALGKPIFLDKPFADTRENALEILRIAEEKQTRFYTTSPLRYEENLVQAHADCPRPDSVHVWGPIGKAAAGSSIIWYGCHAFEILETLMGRGAAAVDGSVTPDAILFRIIYRDGRRGIVELDRRHWTYGALLRDADGKGKCFNCGSELYTRALGTLSGFFSGAPAVAHADSLEVISLLDAADRAASSGKTELIFSKEC